MVSAELLREAASLIRERALVATPGPWSEYVLGSEGYDVRGPDQLLPTSRIPRRVRVARCGYEAWEVDKANAEHIAAWHPAVALAVADWLEAEADGVDFAISVGVTEQLMRESKMGSSALAVAVAYLNREA